MQNLDIVVAHYNSRSFEEVITEFQTLTNKYRIDFENIHINKVFVYNKSSNNPVLNENNTYTIKNLPNVGREGETYLNHIIENYDNLQEYTLFIQDDTHNHVTPYKKFCITICRQLLQKKEYYIYPAMYRIKGAYLPQHIVNGYSKLPFFKNPYLIKESCERLNICLPEKYSTNMCAFLLLSKQAVHKHNVEFYKKLREWLLENETHGYCLEYIWEIIFR